MLFKMILAIRVTTDHTLKTIVSGGYGVMVCALAMLARAVAAIIQDGQAGRNSGIDFLLVG